jgi:hypothetical protein
MVVAGSNIKITVWKPSVSVFYFLYFSFKPKLQLTGMNRLRPLEHWDRGFESHSRHGCLYCVRLFCVSVVLRVGSGLATGWSLVQGILPTVYRVLFFGSKVPIWALAYLHDLRQSVGLLGRVISSSQGLYMYTKTEKRTHTHTHKHWISMPWVGFEPLIPASERAKTVHALDRSATVTRVYKLRNWKSGQGPTKGCRAIDR